MNMNVRLAVAALAALIVSGCASLITGGPLLRPGEPTGVIQVVNSSRYVVDGVLISACEMSSYGLNRLPSGTVIRPGGSYTFRVSAGCWDVYAGASNSSASVRQRMQVRAGGGVRYVVH